MNRNTWLALVSCAAMLLPRITLAQCNSIRDTDQRHLCEARTTRSPTPCNSINDHDLRYFCEATVTGHRTPCNSINDSDLRHQCEAATHN